MRHILTGAEGSVHDALGWDYPTNVCDLFSEFRDRTNGMKVPLGNSLLGAMIFYGIGTMSAEVKTSMRDLILGGGPFNEDEQMAILNYCEEDVQCLVQLLRAMVPILN